MAEREWELPFAAGEYDGRLRRVRLEMERRGIDLLYVTSPSNLAYLLGYDSVWFDARNVAGLAIPQTGTGPVFFDTLDHETIVPATVTDFVVTDIDVASYYPGSLGRVATALRERGILRGGIRVALEYWSSAPGGPALAALARRFREVGAEVVNGSFVVDHVRLVKSPQELAYVRKALEIGDAALTQARNVMRPGVTEKQIAGVLYNEILRLGGDEPAVRAMVHFGPDSARYHRPAGGRGLQNGDLVTVDVCASYQRYQGNTARTFSLGANTFWSDMLQRANEALWSTTRAVKPGEPTRRLQELMDEAVDVAGLRDYAWRVGGFTLGLAVPPECAGHVCLSEQDGFEAGYLVDGFVANWQCLLEDRSAGEGGALIDTFIVTETGIELPASFPRTLTLV